MMRRFSASDLPKLIPGFPLPGALLLLHARLPLNIFEPHYLRMFNDALGSSHRLIGMIQPVESNAGDQPRLHQIGCAGRITNFSETGNGRRLIALTGISRFRVYREVEGFTPYRRLEVRWADFASDLNGSRADSTFDRPRFIHLLSRYFKSANLPGGCESLREANEELLINSLAMLCPFSTQEKQALLEAASLTERRETMTALMEFAIASTGGHSRLQ